MNPSDLILGVDGGGTSTIAWLGCNADPAKILGRGRAGPSNLQAIGPAAAFTNLEQAIRATFDTAGLPATPVAAACLALAGSYRDADRELIEQWAIHARLAERLKIVNDAEPLLYAAHRKGSGVALIVGTGSLAFGRNADGLTARSGGWGPLFGDEGSGYAIVLAGLRAAARSADGRGPRTELLPRFLQAFDRSDPAALVSVMYQPEMTRTRISSLANVVFDACAAGDPLAESIIAQAAKDLAEMVAAVLRQLEMEASPVRFALSGGVAIHHPCLQLQLHKEFRLQNVHIECTTLVTDPVAGAVGIASNLLA